MSRRKPKLIVFDLDYTLWPFWLHCEVGTPFYKSESGIIINSKGDIIRCYEEVPMILEKLYQKGYIIAIASKSPKRQNAEQLFELFDWNKYITYKEIYPGNKTIHFSKLKEKSKILYKDMLFFDDEIRNIYDLREKGVVSVLVKDGVNIKVVRDGLKDYERERSYK